MNDTFKTSEAICNAINEALLKRGIKPTETRFEHEPDKLFMISNDSIRGEVGWRTWTQFDVDMFATVCGTKWRAEVT